MRPAAKENALRGQGGIQNTQPPHNNLINGSDQGRNSQPVCAFPKSESRRADVLNLLLSGERLTQAKTLNFGMGWSLAEDIRALRLKGWPISTEMLDRGKGRARIAEYSIAGGAQ